MFDRAAAGQAPRSERRSDRRSRRGSVAVIVAVMLTLLIGFSALGTEIVFLLFKQRQMQAAASAAAFAGAVALMAGNPPYATEARAVATSDGFTSGTASATVTVNNPPTSGNNAGVATAVEVIITQPQTLPLSSFFYSGTWAVTARAVATAGSSAACILELDTLKAGAVSLTNGAAIKLTGCGLAVNSTGTPALTVSGATVTATTVTVGGTISGAGNITAPGGVKSNQAAVTDPYAGRTMPAASGCTYTSKTTSGTATVSPGTYCGSGLSMGGGGTVTMNPGVYIMNTSNTYSGFTVGGGTAVNGTGVTIVLTGTSSSTYGFVTISNGGTVTLSAPTTGVNKGLLFFSDRNAPASTPTTTFNASGALNLSGALYFPTQTVAFLNGSSTSAVCTQLIAFHMSFTGGATLAGNCANAGTSTIGALTQVVE